MDKRHSLAVAASAVLVLGFVVIAEDRGFLGHSSYTVEDFSSSYRVVNSTGYTVYIEENLSTVKPGSKVLEVNLKDEQRYSELSGIMFQFGNPDLDGGPDQDWNPSLNPRTRNAIEGHDYIRYRSSYYNLSYEGPTTLPGDEVSFDARLLDGNVTPGDPAKIELELKINSENNVSISTGAPYPFKTLSAVSAENRICVWSREYVKSQHVSNWCEEGGMVNAVGLIRTHQPGDVIRRNYSIRSQDVEGTGSYVIEEDVEYQTREAGKTLEYRISFNLAENQ